MWARLDEELISPSVESLERLGAVNVVDEYTAVRAAVEGNTQRLEALLPRRVPQLRLD